jgi:exo-1,4-beta-D-glucosaminidase
VSNPSTDTIALLVRLRLLDESGKDILPILWDDNYFSLVPGEAVQVAALYQNYNVTEPTVVVEVYNNISGK